MPVIFFDIGDTLASPVFTDDGHLKGFTVFPDALTALNAVKSGGYEMGIISNAGNERPSGVNDALKSAGLYDFFNPTYIFYKKKDSPEAFSGVARDAGLKPDQWVFVGENSRERSFALKAGFMRVAPHPLLALDVIRGAALVYLNVGLNDQNVSRFEEIGHSLALVPLKISGGQNKRVYAIATLESVDILSANEFNVEVLGTRDAPLETDLYLVRDDREVPSGFINAENFSSDFLAEEGKSEMIVGKSEEGVYVAIPSDESIEDVHFPDSQHGHNERLLPDFSLFNVIGTGEEQLTNESMSAGFAASFDAEVFQLSNEQKAELEKINAERIRSYLDPYAALAPLVGNQRIVSRHIRHADNRLVVETLQNDLKRIGGNNIQVSRHRFQHGNLFLYNVIAEYPGDGDAESLVLVTAHLDSTANSGGGTYNPVTDPAPGADDDASGIAAVLAIAETIGALYTVKKPKKTIRFVLFNAEEHGLIGSKAYARSQAAISAKIDAVFQMDMIGYAGDQPGTARRFEVHAGFSPSATVEKRSLDLAKILEKIFKSVSPHLAQQQVYPDSASGNGNDPAAGRSDHASFQERGYAAIAVSEDFFAGPGFNSPTAQPNPNYHKPTDREVDYKYAADIARVIACATLIAANT